MNILIACEFSGVVREAFRAKGHNAWSCDLLPAEDGSYYHHQCDIFELLTIAPPDYWDMMIAFPPCTHLSVSGARWFKDKKVEQEESLNFIRSLMELDIPKICLENPVGIISTKIRKPTQIIQPYQFGEDASKRTCLWLKGLPPLVPTKLVPPSLGPKGKPIWANQTPSGQNKLGPSEDRWKLRSRTYEGIGKAMADQWSDED